MSISPFAFDPPTGWNDPDVFPTYEASEMKVRADLQKLHDQTRDYINGLVSEVNVDVLKVSTTVNAVPKTVYNQKITASHVLLHAEIGTPNAVVGEWTVTTADGSLTIDGALNGSTTLVLILAKPRASF